MAVGSALGGWASAVFGYQVAFLINAASFLVSAYSVWLVPEEATRDGRPPSAWPKGKRIVHARVARRFAIHGQKSFRGNDPDNERDLGDGRWAVNIIFERLGGIYFAAKEGWNPDIAVAILWTASGFGLTVGMLIAHRTSTMLDRRNANGIHRLDADRSRNAFCDRRTDAYADAVRVFCVHFARDRRCRIRRAGNAISTQLA